MSTEQLEHTLPSPHRGLQLVLSPENCYSSMPESPDSNRSFSNSSDRESSGSPDNNECSLVDNYYNINSVASNTFNVTPVNSRAVLLSSFEVSNRDSTADDCCFLSSKEMVIRDKSFSVEDPSPIGVSSLDESFSHPAESPACLSEFNLQAVSLLDVSENSTERDEYRNHPGHGMTKENDIAASTSAKPSERGHLMTFTVCERSGQSGKEDVVTNAEAEMLPYFSEVTPEQGKTFVFSPVTQNHVDEISTPVPVTGKKISRLLSFSASPCIGSANRRLHPVTQRQVLVTRKQHLVERSPASAVQDNKMEVKKSDFRNVRPKAVTRSWHRVAVTGSTSQVNNKCSVTRRGTTVRVGSPKMSVSAAVDRHCPAVNDHVSSVQCSNISHSSFKKCTLQSGQTDSKPTPKNSPSIKINIKSGSALDQVRPPVSSTQPRRSSQSSSLTARLPKEKRSVSTSDTAAKSDTTKGHTKPGNLKCSSRKKQATQFVETNSCTPPTEVPKTRLLTRSSKSTTAGVSWDDCKSRFQRRTLSTTPCSQSPGGTRKAQGRSSMSQTERMAQSKQPANAMNHGMEPLHETTSAASIKAQLCGLRLLQSPTRPSPFLGPLRKTLGLSKGHAESRVHTELVSGAAVHKPTQFKSIGLKARLISKQNTGPSLTAVCKPTATTGKGASDSAVGILKRTASTRHGRPTSVDKNKSKSSSQQQQPYQRATQPKQRNGPLVGEPAVVTEGKKKDQSIQTDCNSKYDAVSIILQKALVEFDDATKKCRGLSQELNDLRGELLFSVSPSECLEKEKNLHELLQAKWDKSKSLMQQQMKELEASHEAMKLELESKHEQLQHITQQHEMSLEELNKTKKDAAALSEHIEDLTAKNNALIGKLTAEENRSKELAEKTEDDSHILYLEHELESLKAVVEIKNKQLHEQEKMLMEKGQQTEKNVPLDENLKKIQPENNGSHILYLEQELESVRVVLDIKTKQLHQLEKKLMDMDQIMEKNAMLDESLIKIQQENEHLKARMERQAALSRQLSTEQAALQECLQKESQLNKRLSMENEELLWKLYNGDLSSPQKMSPTSTPISFTLQSPHSSGLSSSSALSPR